MLRAIWVAVLASIVVWAGCSADSGGTTNPQVGGSAGISSGGSAGQAGAASGGVGGSAGAATGGTGAGGSSGSAGGSAGSGGVQDAGPPDVTFSYDGPLGDGTVTQDSACASNSAVAEKLPLDMYIMLDRSGSMRAPQSSYAAGDCNVGQNVNSRWCYAINALAGFFNAPTSAGMGVAMQFFPNGTCSLSGCCSSGSCCQGGPDSTPAVAYGLLAPHYNTLVNAMNAQIGSGVGTPIEAGLRGLANYTANNRRPQREMIGILITDGAPEGCNQNASQLAGIVSQHLSATGIKTFVIGMEGADFNVLETIAASGGAPSHTSFCASGASSCHYYNVGSGNAQPLINALQQIQQSVLGCSFAAPTTDAGIINWNNVTLEYSPMGSGTPQGITRVNSQGACGPNGGWYYDNNNAPTTINLCPATCSVVQSDSQAKVEVLLGCLGS